jgi:hypothetical protein
LGIVLVGGSIESSRGSCFVCEVLAAGEPQADWSSIRSGLAFADVSCQHGNKAMADTEDEPWGMRVSLREMEWSSSPLVLQGQLKLQLGGVGDLHAGFGFD